MVDVMLTPRDVAALLNRTPRQVLNLIARGLLQAQRLGPATRGGRWVVERESVERLKDVWAIEPPKPGRKPASVRRAE